jgi:DNA-binding response OmpR family regulator
MNPPYETLLISESDDMAAAIFEQFLEVKEFKPCVKTMSDAEAGPFLGSSPAFMIFVSISADRRMQELAVHLKAQLPGSYFLVIYADSAPIEFPGIKIKAPFRVSDLFRMLYDSIVPSEPCQNRWRFSGFEYNAVEKNLTHPAGRVFRLTEKEAAILTYLYEADGKAVSREMLLRDLWGYHSDTETHTVETHVYRLRQKIEKDLGHSQIIITDQQGYRLIR